MTDPQPGSGSGEGVSPQEPQGPQGPYEYPPLGPDDTGTPPPYTAPGGWAGYPPPPPPPSAPGYPPPPPPGYSQYGDPSAPYGRHPVTGEPFSDKSKTVAGLLQLLGLFGFLGIGRMYIGQTGFGVAQLLVGLVVGIVTCGFGFVVPAVWGIVDAVLILTDRVRDAQGRPLRDGT
jgi:TM2 domain-containing membrane protein YozV